MIIGIVDNYGQPHCLEHAATVSTWRFEIHDYSSSTYYCWCGDRVEAPEPKIVPHPPVWPNYIDNKGDR